MLGRLTALEVCGILGLSVFAILVLVAWWTGEAGHEWLPLGESDDS